MKQATQITDAELPTILAALRDWQYNYCRGRDPIPPADFIGYFDEYPPLRAKDIDALCKRLNTEAS